MYTVFPSNPTSIDRYIYFLGDVHVAVNIKDIIMGMISMQETNTSASCADGCNSLKYNLR